MVHHGRQKTHVLQRSSGERVPPPLGLPFTSASWTCLLTGRVSVSQDAYARGEVFIGSKENSYTVLSGLPQSTQGYHWNHGITIVTPDRKFLFACETEAEQRDWIAAFQRVINRPMRPQEYAGAEKSKLLTKGISGNFFVVLFFLRFTLFLVLIIRFIFNKQRY